MSEDEYISRLNKAMAQYGVGEDIPLDVFQLVEQALRDLPNSAKLWELRGRIIQLGSEDIPFPLSEALRSYERAVEVDPDFAEVYNEIGYFHDVFSDDYKAAEAAFRRAIDLGYGEEAHRGLARVLAQQGKREQASKVLNALPRPLSVEAKELLEEVGARLVNRHRRLSLRTAKPKRKPRFYTW